MMKIKTTLVLLILTLITMCTSYPPMPTVSKVDINRYMGDWYVIANIPTFLEEGAHNAVESYRLGNDGTIETTFTFREDSFKGELQKYHPRGFIRNKKTNATWDMQFLWPFKSEFLIIYVNDDYTQTIVGRTKRDYVWIMAKTPNISENDYKFLVKFIEKVGYDPKELQKIPQKWEIK